MLNNVREDVKLIDAIYQWAVTPTGTTAINKGHTPYHLFIEQNLKARYSLSDKEAAEIFEKARKTIEGLGIDFERGFHNMGKFVKSFLDDNPLLLNRTLESFSELQDEGQWVVWLFRQVQEKSRFWSGDHRDNQQRFIALLKATFNLEMADEEIKTLLIVVGCVNVLEWVTASGNRHDMLEVPHYLKSFFESINDLVDLPTLPDSYQVDFQSYIDSLFARRRFEELGALEELFTEGFSDDLEIVSKLPQKPFIIGKTNGCAAINFITYVDLKDYFQRAVGFEKRNDRFFKLQKSLESVLDLLKDRLYPSFDFEVLQYGRDWNLYGTEKSLADKEIHVALRPWVLNRSELDFLRRKAETHYVLLLTTTIGIPEINMIYRRNYLTHLDDDNLDWILLDFSKGKMIERSVSGNKPMLYKKIAEELRKYFPSDSGKNEDSSEVPGEQEPPDSQTMVSGQSQPLEKVKKLHLWQIAEKILRESGQPMSPKEIWQVIANRNLFHSKGRTPERTLYTQMLWRCKNAESSIKRQPQVFYRTSPGEYGLYEWHHKSEGEKKQKTPQILPPAAVTPPVALASEQVLVGFECGTGREVKVQPAHLFVSGMSQKSGKTTTLEAIIQRSGLKAVAFLTKPGEKCFDSGFMHVPYFCKQADWKVVEKLFESLLREKMKDVRADLIELCKYAETMEEVKQQIDEALHDTQTKSKKKSLILLQAYFDDLFQELNSVEHTDRLSLEYGLNLMDLTPFSGRIQGYILNSVINEVLQNEKNTVVVVPEAWKFIPQSGTSSCSYSIEKLVRQGAVRNNFVWFDSQDIAGVDKSILKNVSVWLLGYQAEINEVKHTIKQIPLPKNSRPKEEHIMCLQLGEFFLCCDGKVTKTYVMPSWMEEDEARDEAKNRASFSYLNKMHWKENG